MRAVPLDDLIRRLRKYATEGHHVVPVQLCREAADALAAAPDAPPADEPVAWRCKLHENLNWTYFEANPLAKDNCPWDVIEPLYARGVK